MTPGQERGGEESLEADSERQSRTDYLEINRMRKVYTCT